jgi:hypothetical protein
VLARWRCGGDSTGVRAARAPHTAPPLRPPPRGGRRAAQDRLALAVPDHDLDHLRYEDADKSIADLGWWEQVDRDERRIVLVLHGRAGPVRYALISTGRDWLLHRTRQQP